MPTGMRRHTWGSRPAAERPLLSPWDGHRRGLARRLTVEGGGRGTR
jgi:hypothetical protein